MMKLFIDFVHKYGLKNKTTSRIKINQVLSFFELDNLGINLLDGPFSSDVGIVNLHLTKGTHWIAYTNEFFLIVMVVRLLKNYLRLL